ncbi:MAG: hypothetical protein KC561_18035 [Myxococcales bacterium]|nr:hypothetical protein [Myxococcales bacterium]
MTFAQHLDAAWVRQTATCSTTWSSSPAITAVPVVAQRVELSEASFEAARAGLRGVLTGQRVSETYSYSGSLRFGAA